MKKYFSFFAAAMMACCAIVSCDKDNGGKTGGNEEKPGGETPSEIRITIDGDFTDWDAITESSEDGTVYFCAEADPDYRSFRNLKATSDADCIYMCVEVSVSKIFMAEGGKRGDSNEGMGTATPGPIWIYIDSDNNPATGILPHWIGGMEDGGPAFSNFQCDNCIQIYNWIATETGLWDMSWSQINFKQDNVDDGDSIDNCGNWPATDLCPGGYGWAPSLDNTFITFDNFKTKINGAWAICEFAIDRTCLFNNNGQQGKGTAATIPFGLANQSGSADGAWNWSGIIPGGREPAYLTLK